jgi:hypothetical protein
MKKELAFLFVSLLIPGVLFLPYIKQPSSFRRAAADLYESTEKLDSDDEFVVLNGQLYLRVQTAYHSLIFVSGVSTNQWNSAKLWSLIERHKELKPLLPNPDATDGGISWLSK